MPRQLINLLGIVATIGILALAIALVALPIYFQSLTTSAQTAQVAQTNDLYQAQVDALRVESERMDEIEASVAELRTQIPAANELDDVFEVVARAAAATDVTVVSIAAGENAAFVVRTEPLAIGDLPDAPATSPDTTSDAEAGDSAADAEGAATESTTPTTDEVPVGGRQQVDFTINVTADDLGQAVAFLDALRSGPRLLSSIESVLTNTGTGYAVNVSALTFVLPEV